MSMLPKRGVCFECGHDHGDGLGSPRVLEILTDHMQEVAGLNKTIADLRAALAAKTEAPAMTVEPLGYMSKLGFERLKAGRSAAFVGYPENYADKVAIYADPIRAVPAVQQGGEADRISPGESADYQRGWTDGYRHGAWSSGSAAPCDRDAVLEGAAKVCDGLSALAESKQEGRSDDLGNVILRHHMVAHSNSADAIRSLKSVAPHPVMDDKSGEVKP